MTDVTKFAEALVHEDRVGYDTTWDTINSAKNRAELEALHRTCETANQRAWYAYAKGVWQDDPVQLFSRTSLSGYALFLRLLEVADALNDVVQTLGTRWSAVAGADAAARFQRAPVKTPKRAIEKRWRSYNGRPENLVDIVRTSIVCGEVAEIHAVMQAIVADDTVEIVRIKNRFAPHHDARLTAGYRDLALNLKLTPRPAHPAHAEAIFEVQIQIQDIYNIKSVEGHVRFWTIFHEFSALHTPNTTPRLVCAERCIVPVLVRY